MRTFPCFALVVLIAACESNPPLPAQSGDLEDLVEFISVPVEDRFARAQQAGDSRFIGVYGPFLAVPGVPNYFEEHWPDREVLPVPGTSDYFTVEGERELNERAFAYALQYNQLVLGAR